MEQGGVFLGIYLLLLIFWLFLYFMVRVVGKGYKKESVRWKKVYALITGSTLALIMALRDVTVGSDTAQYLYRYFNVPIKFTLNAFTGSETLFYSISTMLKELGISYQGYLALIALIVSSAFTFFYYRYSRNMFLSFYLHVTIGLFSVTMSAFRQTIAICIILFAFDAMLKNKFFKFVIIVLIASLFHTSAIFFLPIYFIKDIKITKRRGIFLFFTTITMLVLVAPIATFFEFILPARYIIYGLHSELNPISRLLIVTSLLIPAACLFFWSRVEKLEEKEFRLFSILIVLSCVNAFINIMALNSSMILRMSFYFTPFNMILIPNIIEGIRNKPIKLIALYAAVLLPLIQFILSTPGGTLDIDNYKFFWQ